MLTPSASRPSKISRLGALLLGCLLGSTALAETRILLTLEWPPYTGIKEPDGGTVTRLVKSAFAAEGDDTRIGYFSWRRALQLPRTDRRFAAIYPMYYAKDRESRCYFSEPIGYSPVGLAERRQRPLRWQQLTELAPYTIGVVNGYVNSPEFDALVQAGKLKVLASENDEQNLKQLLNKRVDAVVIDHNTFHYLDQGQTRVRGMSRQLQLNGRLLIKHPLYMCFPRDDEGLALREQFNRGLRLVQSPPPAKPGQP